MKRALTLVALTTLCFAGWSAARNRRLRASSQTPRQAVQTWEGEGGGLPDGGPGEHMQPTASGGNDAAVYADAAERDASA